MADQNPIFSETVRTAVVLSYDEKIRLQCEAREDYYRRVGWKDEEIVNLMYKKQQLTKELEQLKQKSARLTSIEHQLAIEKQRLTSENEHLCQLPESAGISEIKQQADEIDQQAKEIERLRQLLKSAGISDTSTQNDPH